MGVFSSVKSWFVTTEADVEKFIEDVWDEIPIAAAKIAAIAKWVVKVGLPGFQQELDAAMPFMMVVGSATGHQELNASLVALQSATHAVNSALGSAQAGSLTSDQVVAAIGALQGAKATFTSAKALTAQAVAAAPMTGSPPK